MVFASCFALYIGLGYATRPFPSRFSSPRIRPGGSTQGKRNGEGDRTGAGRDVPRGEPGKKSSRTKKEASRETIFCIIHPSTNHPRSRGPGFFEDQPSHILREVPRPLPVRTVPEPVLPVRCLGGRRGEEDDSCAAGPLHPLPAPGGGGPGG